MPKIVSWLKNTCGHFNLIFLKKVLKGLDHTLPIPLLQVDSLGPWVMWPEIQLQSVSNPGRSIQMGWNLWRAIVVWDLWVLPGSSFQTISWPNSSPVHSCFLLFLLYMWILNVLPKYASSIIMIFLICFLANPHLQYLVTSLKFLYLLGLNSAKPGCTSGTFLLPYLSLHP